jgi:chemotaxis protein MotA
MDILTILGVVVAIGGIIGGMLIEGGHLHSLMNLPAFVIVFGGTFGAVMIQTQGAVLKHTGHVAMWVLFPPKIRMEEGINKIVEWSTTARKEGLLGLEAMAETETDKFAKKGLLLLVDGSEPAVIRGVLEVEMMVKSEHDKHVAHMFEAMGGFAPTIGIIGAVLGLIHVMGNLADPSKLGGGIAAAFVATIYGLVLANVISLPVANKIISVIKDQLQFREMMIEGIIAIAEGENPKAIEMKLQGYLHH